MNWQQIESAPKERTSVLIWDGDVMEVCYYAGESKDSWGVVRGSWCESNGEGYSCYFPTHWMPLPEPPK